MIGNSKFIQLKEQIVNVNSIVKVDQPRSATGVDWYIRTVLDTATTQEPYIQSFYQTEDDARKAYSKIMEQLCN